MRGTLVFVHGTGVRASGLDRTWEAFSRGAGPWLDGVTLEVCDWGPAHGADLRRVDLSLPKVAAPAEAVDDSDSPAAWELLIADPLFELRLAAESEPRAAAQVVPGRVRPDDEARGLIEGLQRLEELDSDGLLDAAGISGGELRAAAAAVSASEEFGQAALTVGDAVDEDFLDATARATVAWVLAAHRGDEPGTQPQIAFRPDLRAQVVDLVAVALFPGATRAIGAWLRRKVLRFAAQRVTDLAASRRQDLMGMAGAAMADILHYQRRGAAIRDYVARSLHGRAPPVVAVGHSLGGVILVDLLTSEGHPEVDLLVTVGSQAPLFYAIDALEHLRPGGVHRPFTPWLNIYSEHDFLSFCAEAVFPGDGGIIDHPVDAGVPFPESHSAYWSLGGVFETIAAAWPGQP